MNSTSSLCCPVIGNEDEQHKYLNIILCYISFPTEHLTRHRCVDFVLTEEIDVFPGRHFDV